MISLFTSTPLQAALAKIQLDWQDSSDKEQGFYVQRRKIDEQEFTTISTRGYNKTSHTANVKVPGHYCFRIVAFNKSGESPSSSICRDFERPEPNRVRLEFEGKPGQIDLQGKEYFTLHGFKSGNSYGQKHIITPVFDTREGTLRSFADPDHTFKEQGDTVDTGYTVMGFSYLNRVSIPLVGYGKNRTATFYIKAKAVARAPLTIEVRVGGIIEEIPVKGSGWNYIKVNVDYYGPVEVTFRPNSTDVAGTRGQFALAGVVLDNTDKHAGG